MGGPSLETPSVVSAASPVVVLSSSSPSTNTHPSTSPTSTSLGAWRGGVDTRDADTPDRWVERHPSMVRLTGRHPFNAEPPVTDLVEEGGKLLGLTPNALHYVRNHGPVPKLSWETHTLGVRVRGQSERVFTMEELWKGCGGAIQRRSVMVTMACAGNRRKEQNMIKQSKGFHWGPAGVSTAVWEGLRLCDLLALCGVTPELARDRRYYAHMSGADTLPNGVYATSIPLSWAMDPANDVLVAMAMNGELLAPDHGFPVRTIIPGMIGGRTIKWMKSIEVKQGENDTYYHYRDNRVLPPHVDAELADKEGWWHKPQFIIMHLNVNSAMARPAHNEVLHVVGATNSEATYTCRGYAYSGGGRAVTRVELTLDSGASWRQADWMEAASPPNEYGKQWTWVLWECVIRVSDLANATSLSLRAWDDALNTQPRDPTWNVMGMMHNPWFRVFIHKKEDGKSLTFEHPTQPGNLSGGWMARENAEKEEAEAAAAKMIANRKIVDVVSDVVRMDVPASAVVEVITGKKYTMKEVEAHNAEKDVWIVVGGKVYDCTPFLKEHPGGAESILINAGTDATDEFDAIHSKKARAMLAEYYIGDLAEEDTPAVVPPLANGHVVTTSPEKVVVALDTPAVAPAIANGHVIPTLLENAPVALDPKKRIPFRLIEKEALSHDVRRFRFALQSNKHVLGLPVGKHMFLSATVGDKMVMRAYTPTSSDDDVGYFELVVKVYFKGVNERFPDGGIMSQYLESLCIGDTIDVKGPLGHVHYLSRGNFTVDREPKHATHISMIAGGTGITPMIQIIKAVLKDSDDKTELSLLFANQTEDDILLRSDLDELAERHNNFRVWYTLSRPPKEWKYSEGFINEDMCRATVFPSSPTSYVFMCGPPPMIKFACVPNLEKMGFTAEQMVTF
eukprot:jgi/Chlat1/3372/Chrsp23S00270